MTQRAFRARPRSRPLLPLLLAVMGAACHTVPVPATGASAPPTPRAQNPSPMMEQGRRHDRIPPRTPADIALRIETGLPKPVDLYIPVRSNQPVEERTLLVHFFGAAYIPLQAAVANGGRYVVAVVNLGAGSSAYERPFADTATWHTLLRRVQNETSARTAGRVRINRIIVSAFSAGYGGVRALLRDDQIAASINGVILLDGFHTSYVPERTVLAEGGALDTTNLVTFLRYARRAVAGETRMLITHSEIFPGTFASTTETTDWLIAELGLARKPVLEWGPGGMQQISEVRSGGLTILGFAGNAGPDHIDHLHGLGAFLARMEQ
ncbi:MAG: hypothetical protein M3Z17_08365 [Gemmatimonadota bacterium]|nr:hypothetical protein [Gemmatimonadota bacterium]